MLSSASSASSASTPSSPASLNLSDLGSSSTGSSPVSGVLAPPSTPSGSASPSKSVTALDLKELLKGPSFCKTFMSNSKETHSFALGLFYTLADKINPKKPNFLKNILVSILKGALAFALLPLAAIEGLARLAILSVAILLCCSKEKKAALKSELKETAASFKEMGSIALHTLRIDSLVGGVKSLLSHCHKAKTETADAETSTTEDASNDAARSTDV